MPSIVVGAWTIGMPRRYVAAAAPARSVVTPPPTARMVSERSARWVASQS